MNELTTEDLMRLEELIDKRSLTNVLAGIASICDDKVVHIQTNWQDAETAKPWHQAARKVWSTWKVLAKNTQL